MRSSLFCDVTQRRLVICYRRFGTTYRSHLPRVQQLDAVSIKNTASCDVTPRSLVDPYRRFARTYTQGYAPSTIINWSYVCYNYIYVVSRGLHRATYGVYWMAMSNDCYACYLKTLCIVGFQEEWDRRGMWHAWGYRRGAYSVSLRGNPKYRDHLEEQWDIGG